MGKVTAFLVTSIAVIVFGFTTHGNPASAQDPVQEVSSACAANEGGASRVQFSLDEEASETELKIRTADVKNFSLVLASNCLLEAGTVDLKVSIEPSPADYDDFPQVVEDSAEVHYRVDGATVVLPVSRADVHPGIFDGAVVVAGPGAATIRVPITLTVKDRRLHLPALSTAIGLLAGVVAAAFTTLSNREADFRPVHDTFSLVVSSWGIVALAVAFAVGFVWTEGPYQTLVGRNDAWLWTMETGAGLVARAFASGAGVTVAALFLRGSKKAASRAE